MKHVGVSFGVVSWCVNHTWCLHLWCSIRQAAFQSGVQPQRLYQCCSAQTCRGLSGQRNDGQRTRMPAAWQVSMAAATSGRGGSCIAAMPRKVRPASSSGVTCAQQKRLQGFVRSRKSIEAIPLVFAQLVVQLPKSQKKSAPPRPPASPACSRRGFGAAAPVLLRNDRASPRCPESEPRLVLWCHLRRINVDATVPAHLPHSVLPSCQRFLSTSPG